MAAYPEKDLVSALDAVWARLTELVTEEEKERLMLTHPVLDELEEFGPGGPLGAGLGRCGGHAIE